MTAGFQPPVYPYERLAGARAKADAHEGGIVDLSVGTPCDPPPPSAVAALSTSGAERGYPMSVGSARYRGRGPRLARQALRRRGASGQRRRLHRDQGAGGHAAPVAAAEKPGP